MPHPTDNISSILPKTKKA